MKWELGFNTLLRGLVTRDQGIERGGLVYLSTTVTELESAVLKLRRSAHKASKIDARTTSKSFIFLKLQRSAAEARVP